MKAVVLVKKGAADKAFEIREKEIPTPTDDQVLIKVEAFGLNFADVMARHGLYKDAPPIPAVLGYDVVGRITQVGKNVKSFTTGQRVLALSRFGGYAEYVATDHRAIAAISEEMPVGEAVALATQYCTAYYCTEEVIQLNKGDHVLIHAAAGGVGTALVQMAKNKGCVIFGTASKNKHKYLKEQGVDFPIDYRTEDFSAAVTDQLKGRKLDVIFDPVGGDSVKKGYHLLDFGGRIICYGGSALINARGNIFKTIKVALGFGFYSPIGMLTSSKGIIGVNMLRIADHRPYLFQKCLNGVIEMYDKKLIKPIVGGEFKASEIALAHAHLENRGSIGKIVVKW